MFLKLVGLVDILAVIVVIASPILPMQLILLVGSLLLFKGGFFALQGDAVSILDVICGFLILFLAFGVFSTIIMVGAVLFLVQKIFFTLI